MDVPHPWLFLSPTWQWQLRLYTIPLKCTQQYLDIHLPYLDCHFDQFCFGIKDIPRKAW